MLETLVSNGADLEMKSRGMTALVYAVAIGKSETVETLLDLGADPNVKTRHQSLLQLAIKNPSIKENDPILKRLADELQ